MVVQYIGRVDHNYIHHIEVVQYIGRVDHNYIHHIWLKVSKESDIEPRRKYTVMKTLKVGRCE